jgi:hypothetical protein
MLCAAFSHGAADTASDWAWLFYKMLVLHSGIRNPSHQSLEPIQENNWTYANK